MSGPPSSGFDLFSLLFVLKLPDNCSIHCPRLDLANQATTLLWFSSCSSLAFFGLPAVPCT